MEKIENVQPTKNKNVKSMLIKVLLALLFAVIAFNLVLCFYSKNTVLDFCRDACFVFSKDSVRSESYVGGLARADFVGKNENSISDEYNVLLEKYDENGNLKGRYYDTSFAFFMLRDYDYRDDRYVVYADVQAGVISDIMLLNVARYGSLYESNAINYQNDLSKEEINAYIYWNGNGGQSNLSQTSKWERYN